DVIMGRRLSVARAFLWGVSCAGILAAVLVTGAAATTEERKADPEVLRIGNSNSLSTGSDSAKEKGALESLREFIKDETGMKNEIIRAKSCRDVADRMEKGDFHLGVFHGYEFAWVRDKHQKLKPLALAVNVHRYPEVHVVTQKKSKASGMADLQGQTVCM